MALLMQISKEDFEKDSTDCEMVEKFSGCDGPIYRKESHQGLVLETTIKDWYDDWDHIAICWNPETEKPERVMYATSRGWTLANSASVDASDEIQEKYRQYLEAEAKKDRLENPMMGDQVVVVKGRKVPIGVEGEMFWMKEQKFGRNTTVRIGIKDSEGEVHWTYLKNVKGVA